ncbi:hypothetical protein [Methylobacterium sp. V23]|uniref:hypothetical protein n=1 Tax=Methylobacterium sp. V23 TaxID=2044878 RepID=UPI000CDA01AD|nr:hypothetical protein [Methylobacterium sp. V23]POR42659.1 hypothetical protein CRT23_12840 [Methylobacterium sp. V23]
MNFGRAIALTVVGIPGFLSPDHMDDADLDDLAHVLRATLNAVEEERLDRVITQGGAALSSSKIGGSAA